MKTFFYRVVKIRRVQVMKDMISLFTEDKAVVDTAFNVV